MRVSVVLLRRAGVRLRKPELAPALWGDLRIIDQEHTSFHRAVRVAQLWGPTHSSIERPVGLPLFEPVIVRMCSTSFSLSGIELSQHEGRVREFVQVWRCVIEADPHGVQHGKV